MAMKNFLGGAIINYGDTLPSSSTVPDGSLFFKTGSSAGIYLYAFQQDTNPSLPGDQMTQGWFQLVSYGSGVDATTLGGQPPAYYQVASANLNALSAQATTGLMVRTGSGTYTTRAISAGAGIIVSNGDGVSGAPSIAVDPPAININALSGGALLVSKGGTGNGAVPTAGAVAFGTGSVISYTAAGSSGQVLLSGGAGTPTWANQSALSVGFATSANTANSATTASTATTATTAGSASTAVKLAGAGSIADLNAVIAPLNAPELIYQRYDSTAANKPVNQDNANGLLTMVSHPTGGTGVYGKQITFSNNDDLYMRAFSNGAFSAWRRILTDANYNSYAPTLTGAGAAGTWAINVTGSSSSASSATLAAKASTLAQSGGNGAAMTFNWAGQSGQPTWLWGGNDGVSMFVYNPSNFSVNYANTAGSANTANSATTATTATTATNSNNTSSVSNATAGSYAWTGTQSFVSSSGVGVNTSSGTCMPQSTGGATAATISFHRVGAYGLNMGLDTDNIFRIGGWSDGTGTYRMSLDASGNLAVRGNVTGFLSTLSDRRLKEDIQPVANPMEKVQALNGVTYVRKGTTIKNVGLIAQDVQKVLPEAIVVNEEGYLSVAYGNMVGLLVEAIKAQQQEIDALKQQVAALSR